MLREICELSELLKLEHDILLLIATFLHNIFLLFLVNNVHRKLHASENNITVAY